jgi:hypothetical protein
MNVFFVGKIGNAIRGFFQLWARYWSTQYSLAEKKQLQYLRNRLLDSAAKDL